MAAIFLDLDGTLVDPKPGITGSVQHALGELGLAVPTADDLEWVIGPPLLDSFRRLGAADPNHALALYRARYSSGGMFDCAVYDGVPGILAELRAAGHRLFLATAKPHVYAKKITAHFGLAGYLEAEFGPELDGTRNDKGNLLAHACELLGLDPGSAVMIGDRDNDLNAARANAMAFIGVLWGYAAKGELSDADQLCKVPCDLPAAVRALLSNGPGP